jgi:hypothetical protein
MKSIYAEEAARTCMGQALHRALFFENGDDILDKRPKSQITELSDHDRKILDKYTKYYSNFIESNTAESDLFEGARYEKKD